MSGVKGISLADKVAVVTGGTRGIGLEIARTLSSLGARVVIAGQTTASVDAAIAQLGGRETMTGVAGDLALPETPARIAQAAIERFGTIDVLINNAGIAGAVDPWQVEPAQWDRIQAVNLRAAFFCAREAAAAMKASGRGGAIVNVSSVAAQTGGAATGPAYVASKAGVIGLTRSLARHFGPFGVRVNCIAPADIDTDMTAGWSAALRERLIAMTPLGRFGEPSEVAVFAAFLASDAAGYVTGQTLGVNGGLHMS